MGLSSVVGEVRYRPYKTNANTFLAFFFWDSRNLRELTSRQKESIGKLNSTKKERI